MSSLLSFSSLPVIDFLPSVLAGASVVLLALAIEGRVDPALRTWIDRVGQPSSPTAPGINLIARLAWSKVGRRIQTPERVLRNLALAGAPMSAVTLRGLRLATAICCALVATLLSLLSPSAILLVPLAFPAGLRIPDLALARKARRRQQQIGARVPDLVEVLVATTTAGLSPPLAFRRASEMVAGALGDELRVAVRHLDLGLTWRAALEHLADSTDVAGIRRLVAALARSHRLGSPVSSALRSVADDLRGERRTRAEEIARRVPVKMLFPMVFLILPAFLLLTVGPVLLATIRSLR
jgi:tight adherence protein C